MTAVSMTDKRRVRWANGAGLKLESDVWEVPKVGWRPVVRVPYAERLRRARARRAARAAARAEAAARVAARVAARRRRRNDPDLELLRYLGIIPDTY